MPKEFEEDGMSKKFEKEELPAKVKPK